MARSFERNQIIDTSEMILYYRNNSCTRPTKCHILKSSGDSYCGFSDFAAELNSEENMLAGDMCAKCLSSYKGTVRVIIHKPFTGR